MIVGITYFLHEFLLFVSLINWYDNIPLLDIAIPYAIISKIPNGVRKTTRGEILDNAGEACAIALNTSPVENPEKLPNAIPNPGINIPNATLKLFAKIPY